MPFQTDNTWTPSTYRRALAAYMANAPEKDAPLFPRRARTETPRHGDLSVMLHGLLKWKAASLPEDPLATSWMRYDLRPDNDNREEGEPQIYDTTVEYRPSPEELERAWKGSAEGPIVYRRGVAVEGDIAFGEGRGPAYAGSDVAGERAPKRAYRVVTRIGRLRFSNGENEERCLVLREGKAVNGRVRMPEGALIRFNGRKPDEEYGSAKGSLPEVEQTVAIGGHNTGAGLCPDPVVDAEWAMTLRASVDADTAKILDLAVVAANFREVGELLGKAGKTAERAGKAAVLDACEKLDKVLAAANDNEPVKVAA